MAKRRKLFLSLVLVLISFFFLHNTAFALVKPTSNFYVNDYADILSDDVEEYIINHSIKLQEKTKAQIVVVTVKNLEKMTLEEYATKLFRKFGIGDKNENNGLLLLLALEERQFRVEVGYGLEGVLTDGLTGRYQDQYIIPFLKENKWDEGVKNGYNAFYNKLCEYYGIDAKEIVDSQTYKIKSRERFKDFVIVVILLSLVVAFLLTFSFPINFGKKKKKKREKALVIFSWFLFFFQTLPYALLMIFIYWDSIYDINYKLLLIIIEVVLILVGYVFFSFLYSKRIITFGGNSSSGSDSFSSSDFSSDGGGSSGGGGSSRSF